MKQNRKINLFIVDDEPHFLGLMKDILSGSEYNLELFINPQEAIKAAAKKEYDVGLIDINMPEMNGIDLIRELKKQTNTFTEYIVLTGQGSISTAIESMKLGCYDYLTKPIKLNKLKMVLDKAYEKKLLNKENVILRAELNLIDKYYEMVGKSPRMKEIFALIDRVAQTSSIVLITGESGTGKELAAKAIHKRSSRNRRPFIILDCTSIPEKLLENELFGHEKGAFTDATSMKRGLIEVADGGTLFIDEIGEMGISIQSKLLRVIETHRFRRLGSNREIEVDVRIIAATNRNLAEEIEKNNFRKDLFYRLNVVPIRMPALYERKDDIPILVKHFIATNQITSEKKKVSSESMDVLKRYQWPGNVRELANAIERALIVSSGEYITPEDLPIKYPEQMRFDFTNKSMKELLFDCEKSIINETLLKYNGSRTDAAKALGLSRSKLYRKIKDFGIENQ